MVAASSPLDNNSENVTYRVTTLDDLYGNRLPDSQARKGLQLGGCPEEDLWSEDGESHDDADGCAQGGAQFGTGANYATG